MNHNQTFKAGIYIRLSREDEEKTLESESITSQRDLLISYVKQHHFQLIDEYIDDGYTGTNFERPAFKQMIYDIEQKRINMIITKDLSRLGRNNGKVSTYLDEYFPQHNIRYIAINDNYDSFIESPSNDMIAFKSVFNDYYCGDISKKVRTGLRTRKEKGWFTGWKAPYGYQIDPNDKHHLIIDSKVSHIVKRIFQLAYDGASPRQIANILSSEQVATPSMYANLKKASPFWCARTIREMLTNETYIGNLTQGRRKKINYKLKKEVRTSKNDWIIVKNTHEPLVDVQIFTSIQQILSINKRKRQPVTNRKRLQGLLYCKECNHALTISSSNDKKRYYCACSYYRKYSKYHVCTPHTFNYHTLESVILTNLITICQQQFQTSKGIDVLKNYVKHQQHQNQLDHNISQLKQDIKKIEQAIETCYLDYCKKEIPKERYDNVNQKLEIEIKEKQLLLNTVIHKQATLKRNQEHSFDYEATIQQFLKPEHITRNMIIDMIEKIYITEDKKIEIYFRFPEGNQTPTKYDTIKRKENFYEE